MSKKVCILFTIICVLFFSLCGCYNEGSTQTGTANEKLQESRENDVTEQTDHDVQEQKENGNSVDDDAVTSDEYDGLPLGYIAPDGWYSPDFTTHKVVENGGYDLKYNVMGLKVYRVQKALGMRQRRWGYYRFDTVKRVTQFQKENGIEPTGEVDLNTWLKMGLCEKEWYDIGTYVAPLKIRRDFTAQQIIDSFIAEADSYVGTDFVVGASGKQGEGVDCSGLVLQCLYSIGIYPDGLDPVQHSTIEEYNSRLMWEDPKFKTVNRSELKRGDLVFYGKVPGGRVCHVAIYIGYNECIEALNFRVEHLLLNKDNDEFFIVGCKRVIYN